MEVKQQCILSNMFQISWCVSTYRWLEMAWCTVWPWKESLPREGNSLLSEVWTVWISALRQTKLTTITFVAGFITMILYWVLNWNLLDWTGDYPLSGSQEEQVWKASSFVAPISASFLLTSQVLQTLAVEGRLCLWGQTWYLIRT